MQEQPAINPAHARVAYSEARSRSGNGNGSGSGEDGISAFVKVFAPRESKAAFLEWKRNPITVRMIAALRAMAFHQPPMSQQVDMAAQYGMTMGLVLGAQLLEDPASLLPVFNADSPQEVEESGEEDRKEYTSPGV
jgi:hypothetical protein